MEEHARNCARDINAKRFDVLLSGSAARLATTGIARYVDCPSVLYLQEPFRPLYEALPKLPWVAPPPVGLRPVQAIQRGRDALRVGALRVQAREELEGARAYDQLLVNSYFSRESVLRAYGIDAQVCYLGVDTKRYIDLGRDRKRMVVGIGRFDRRKRVEIAIDAVAAIPSPPDLVWIGDYADKYYLRGLVELAARHDVNFTPLVAIPQDEVVEVLNDAAVMLCVARLEPFGYTPLEGGACGVPVVAKAEGGIRETVVNGETGLLVDNDRDLSNALERVCEDRDLAAAMRNAARRNVESRWTVEAAAERLESHLLAVVKTSTTEPPPYNS
jgi:glycosyltransferase involved in cell wall biosynthesis